VTEKTDKIEIIVTGFGFSLTDLNHGAARAVPRLLFLIRQSIIHTFGAPMFWYVCPYPDMKNISDKSNRAAH